MDRNHSLPGSCRLEREDSQKCAPASIGDALGKGVVLRHIGHPQVFMVDHVILLNDLACRCVMEVASLPGDVLLGFGQRRDGLAPAVAALLAPGDASLAAAQIGFGRVVSGNRQE